MRLSFWDKRERETDEQQSPIYSYYLLQTKRVDTYPKDSPTLLMWEKDKNSGVKDSKCGTGDRQKYSNGRGWEVALEKMQPVHWQLELRGGPCQGSSLGYKVKQVKEWSKRRGRESELKFSICFECTGQLGRRLDASTRQVFTQVFTLFILYLKWRHPLLLPHLLSVKSLKLCTSHCHYTSIVHLCD